LLSSVFAKTTGKEKNETKRLQAYVELKMTVKTLNEVAFLSCTSLIVYIELHSSVFSWCEISNCCKNLENLYHKSNDFLKKV